MSVIGKCVYLDLDQCTKFSPKTGGEARQSYYEQGARLLVAADALLKSKDYDKAHWGILEPLGQGILRLSRQPGNAPGWFTILEVS